MNYFFKPRFLIVGTISLMLSLGSVASASHLSQFEVESLQSQIFSALNTINDLEIQLAATGDAASLPSSAITCPSPRIVSDLKSGRADTIITRNPIVRERGQVTALQDFLWQYKGRYSATYWNPLNQFTSKSDLVTGYYGDRTTRVVKAFQQQFGVSGPNQGDIEFGKILNKTRNAIALQCGALTEGQIDAIVNLLRSFGAREAMIAQAHVALTDGVPKYVGAPNPSQAQVDSIIGLLQSFGARSSVITNTRFALTGSATPPSTIIAPSSLTVKRITSGSGEVNRLEWINNGPYSQSIEFEVKRTGTGTTTFNLVGNTVEYIDNFTTQPGTYTYIIRGVNAGYVFSKWSNKAVITVGTPPPPSTRIFRVFENSATSTPYRVVQAGSVGVPLASYIIEGNPDEAILLKQLAFQWGAPASSTPAILQNQTVTIWDGTTQLGTAIFLNNNATSSILNLSIPQGQSKIITIKGDLAQINAVSPTQNIGGLIRIDYDGDNNGINGNYAVGATSGSVVPANSPDRYAQGVRVFRSVPSVVAIPCGSALIYGADLSCFRVTAGSGRDIALRSVAFDIATTSATVRDFQLYGPSGAATGVTNPTDVYDPANGSTDANYLRFVFNDTSVDRLIQAGTSKTYSLRANTIYGRGAGFTGALSTRLHEDTAYPRLKHNVGDVYEIENSQGYIPQEKSFIWTAFSTTTPGTDPSMNSRVDWSNGYKLSGFPLPWQTVTNDMLNPPPPPPPPTGDITPPVVTILLPVRNNAATTTKKSSLPLVGAMFTDKPGTGVATSTAYWKNLTNNATGVLAPSYGWLGGPVALAPGLNTIEVGARDNAGNLGTARFYVTYQVGMSTVQAESMSCGSDNLAGGVDLYCFRIRAIGGDVALRSLAFGVATSSVTVRDFRLYGPNESARQNAVNAFDGTANNSSDVDYLQIVFGDDAPDRIVYAGESKTYRLKADTVLRSNAASTGALTIFLRGDASVLPLPGGKGSIADVERLAHTLRHFIWSGNMSVSDAWVNGYGVQTLPLPSRTTTSVAMGSTSSNLASVIDSLIALIDELTLRLTQ